MMEDVSHFLALHKSVLKTLCRVCGQCLPKNSNHIITIDLMQNISCAFPDNFLEDNPDTHPNKICNNCYSKAKNFVKRNSIHDAMPVLWKPHGDDCKVCSKSRREIGRPKKKSCGRKGRPPSSSTQKAPINQSGENGKDWSNELLSKIFLTSPVTSLSLTLRDLDIKMEQNKHLHNIICCLCNDILKRPVVLNCGHVYCSRCLVTHLRSKRSMCVRCNSIIQPHEDSVRPGTIVNQLLETVNINLKCGCSTQLSAANSHQCFTTLQTPSPSKPIPQNVMNFVGHIVGMQMKQSSLPNNTIQLPSGGPTVKFNIIIYNLILL